jgi:hypothetical protein
LAIRAIRVVVIRKLQAGTGDTAVGAEGTTSVTVVTIAWAARV